MIRLSAFFLPVGVSYLLISHSYSEADLLFLSPDRFSETVVTVKMTCGHRSPGFRDRLNARYAPTILLYRGLSLPTIAPISRYSTDRLKWCSNLIRNFPLPSPIGPQVKVKTLYYKGNQLLNVAVSSHLSINFNLFAWQNNIHIARTISSSRKNRYYQSQKLIAIRELS